MKLLPSLAAAFSMAFLTAASAQTFSDPANLRGERSRPRTGLELPLDQGAPGLAQMLLKLRTRASLMMIVAHPDDEDGGMLTYEVRGHGVRAAMLTLTRGEGGQNLMTGDFNDALGLIRTQELLAADRYFGTDQMFGTEVDFGFSKTREEALAQWTHDRCLYDAVRAVRLYRPLVITSVFTGNPTDGHGHHQVSGQMAQEVFTAAADPDVFPEMLKEGIQPWAPLKVYARVPFAEASKDGIYDYATGKYVPVRFYDYVTKTWSNAVPKADVIIHEGEYSDALGMSYVQFARQGLALQKSQIGAGFRVPPAGAVDVGYTRYGSRVPGQSGSGPQTEEEQSFFDGIDTSLEGLSSLAPSASGPFRVVIKANLAGMDHLLAEAQAALKPAHPEQTAAPLQKTLIILDTLIANISKPGKWKLPAVESENLLHDLRIKRVQLNDALVLALGLRLAAPSPGSDIPAGVVATSTITLTSKSSGGLGSVHMWAADSFNARSSSIQVPHSLTTPAEAPCSLPASQTRVTRPYFSRPSIEQAYYDLSVPAFRNAPTTPPPFTCWAEAEYQGTPITFGAVVARYTQPVSFVPALSVSLSPQVRVLTSNTHSFLFNTQILPSTEGAQVHFDAPPGLSISPDPRGNLPTVNAMFVKVDHEPRHPILLHATAVDASGQNITEGFRSVGYPGVVHTNYYTPALLRVVPVDVKVAPDLRVAYLPGTGDEVQSLLENIGIQAATLGVTDIAAGKLEGFDVLVVGVRAYTAHPDLLVANSHILSFAKNGGTVIVQYQAHAFKPADAPFSLQMGGDGERVVEEVAKVQLSPAPSGVLTYPNTLTPADFDGWVSERGHGFPASWDPAYETPTETHDVGQDPQRGGLLVARYGKGYYAYTAFALYRQLPEAVPGAYRLFANLLSLGRSTTR